MKPRVTTFNLDPKTEEHIKVLRAAFQVRDLTKTVTTTDVIKYALRKAAEEMREESVE